MVELPTHEHHAVLDGEARLLLGRDIHGRVTEILGSYRTEDYEESQSRCLQLRRRFIHRATITSFDSTGEVWVESAYHPGSIDYDPQFGVLVGSDGELIRARRGDAFSSYSDNEMLQYAATILEVTKPSRIRKLIKPAPKRGTLG